MKSLPTLDYYLVYRLESCWHRSNRFSNSPVEQISRQELGKLIIIIPLSTSQLFEAVIDWQSFNVGQGGAVHFINQIKQRLL